MGNVYVAFHDEFGDTKWLRDPEYKKDKHVSIWFTELGWVEVILDPDFSRTKLLEASRQAYDYLDSLNISWGHANGEFIRPVYPSPDEEYSSNATKGICFPFILLDPLPFAVAKDCSGVVGDPAGFRICHGGVK